LARGWQSTVNRSEFNTFARSLDLGERYRGSGASPEPFVPVYRTELTADASVTARRRQFLGWAAGQFRAGDFLEAALGSLPPPQTTGVELHDGELGDDSLIASYPEGFRPTGPYVRTASFT
jgi:CHASE domain